MDQEQLQQKIAEYYEKLPPKTQEVFSSMQWLEVLRTISERYGLKDQQIQDLGTETTLVLLGIIDLDEYENAIKKEVALEEELFNKMSAEINDLILKEIRPELVQAFNANIKPGTEIEEKWKDRFNKLSEEIQNAIIDSDYQKKIYDIGLENKLTINQIGLLEEATNSLIFGETNPIEFENYLKKNVETSDEKSKILVNEINEKVLRDIRQKMMGSSQDREGKPILEETEEEILNNAGIEMIKEEAPEKITPIPNRDELIKKIEHPDLLEKTDKKPDPILSQKLSQVFKTPETKTDHSLVNLKNNEQGTKLPKVDPYRELPE